MRLGHCTAALGLVLLLLLVFSGCAANNPKGAYRAHYGLAGLKPLENTDD
jgi:hypothetical protein